MKVIKRNGTPEDMLFDKVTRRIQKLNEPPLKGVNPTRIAQKVFSSMYDGITTSQIDTLSAEVAVGLITEDPDYETLAMRITVSNLQKTCPGTFSEAMKALAAQGIVAPEIASAAPEVDSWIVPRRDYEFGYFGIKTLQKGYLFQGETPQYMFMRVALGIHGSAGDAARETYDLMSQKYFTHATPTLFNAGTPKPQMSSCFLVAMKEDSIDGIYETLKECAHISKWSGGIGIHCSNVRARGSRIKGTNGVADGLVPMLRVFNNTARYVNQGGGKRKGSFAIYLEPWHADIMEFLELRLNQGDEESRCHDLFTALWIPDLFMKAVEKDQDWHLMCPNECPGLPDAWGPAFDEIYGQYVTAGKFRRVVKARDIWNAMLKSQVETGTPYMCYKDSANAKSNQANIGTIKSSNLCTEIMEVSEADETAVCNLASISLPAFVIPKTFRHGEEDGPGFNFAKLSWVAGVLTRNLNRVIDRNYYPTEAARKSNMRHRPIAIGVQGLADVFMMMGLAFDEPAARKLNQDIFEVIYAGALHASSELARIDGPYETYVGSPASKGLLQYHFWDKMPEGMEEVEGLVRVNGLRNSLLVAPMPTASTAQILGNNEAFEPYTTNIYLRRTLAGEFVMINKHLVRDLQVIGKWSPDIKTAIVRAGGSVQGLDIPERLKEIYRTVWEIPQKSLIDMSADRGAFIDQSQSLNIFMEDPSLAKLSSMHMYGWKKGLKTGMYYLRTRPKAKPQQVTVPVAEPLACSLANPGACEMCSG